MAGAVYLVGAGPGDPGLITEKGLRHLKKAQVVVYDRLLAPSLLEAAPKSAERVFVGKERGRQALSQEEINQVLVERAGAGLYVVRLKGGDPFVFGRGGEEALALARQGIHFEVVPGVTSPVAAAAYAGVPLTHRGKAAAFTVVTGSEDPSKTESSLDWQALARTGGTLVVLMGWSGLGPILQALTEGGMAPNTPAALVQWGTWPKQRTVTGCVEDIVELGREAALEPPVVAIIGRVVELRDKIRWFDQKPLFGKRVLITRSRSQASKLRILLTELGAQPVEVPTILTAPLKDHQALDAALARLSDFSWVIFASVNAVDAVFSRLELREEGRDARAFGGNKVGAIGPATAEALERRGLFPDLVPPGSASEHLIEVLSGRSWTDVAVLLPGADIGLDGLAQGLTRLGARVERVAAYRTVAPTNVRGLARGILEQGVEVVTFTSSSTVRNLLEALDGDVSPLNSCIIACIGPTTAATARELGLKVDLVAEQHDVEGLANALAQHFGDG